MKRPSFADRRADQLSPTARKVLSPGMTTRRHDGKPSAHPKKSTTASPARPKPWKVTLYLPRTMERVLVEEQQLRRDQGAARSEVTLSALVAEAIQRQYGGK